MNARGDKIRESMIPARWQSGMVLLLLAVTAAVYWRILGHEVLEVWDDNFYVTANPDAWGFSLENIRSAFTKFYLGNYAPVQLHYWPVR